MIDEFYYKVYLPSIADYAHCKELYNHEYLNLLKFIKNNDDVCLGRYLEYLMSIKILDRDNYDLHRIDKLCWILMAIAVNIKSSAQLVSTCEETEQQYQMNVDILDLLNIISNVDYQPTTITTQSNITATFRYPDDIFTNTDTVSLQDMMHTIVIDSMEYKFHSFTSDEKKSICDNLFGIDAMSIINTTKSMIDRYNDIEYFSHHSPYIENPVNNSYKFSLIDNSVIQFIKVLIGDDLNRFYELQHAMATNYNFSHEYYMTITPAETQMHFGYMRAETKRRNDEQKESETDSG